jgi:hypothetical protein
LPDEVGIVGRDVSRLGNSPNICLQIQIKSIDSDVAERAGSILRGPCLSDGSESSNEELGKVLCDFLGREVVACGCTSTKREQDLLASPLAGCNTLCDGWARGKEFLVLRRIGRVLVPGVAACVS